MNYSSLAGVAAMVLVMLVVLVSAIYPSRVAAQIAIPDINRSWKLPPAKGNVLELTLPFLVRQEEHLSIGGFLLEYFQNHQDVSHGLFSTDGLQFEARSCPIPADALPEAPLPKEEARPGETSNNRDLLQFQVDIWLAPFDFGIMQSATIAFHPARQEPGYLEIRVYLKRNTGEANAWRRINKAFLDDVRKQILIWRSLDDETKRNHERRICETDEGRNIGLIKS